MPRDASNVLLQSLSSQRFCSSQDEVANGTATVDDDEFLPFFAKGRDFESVGTAHTYTAQEQKLLESFESLEYLPPNNEVYREYLTNAKRPSQGTRWVAMGLIGASVGVVGFLNKSLIERMGGWRRSLLFSEECKGDPANPALYACGFIPASQAEYEILIEAGGEDALGTAVKDLGMLWPVHALVAVAFAGLAAAVVVLFQPAAASSGIPEVIAYLNGTHQRKIFNIRTLTAKFFSCVLAVGSGLPVGPEGPMIHMGAMIGRGVSQMRSRTLGLSSPFFRHFRNPKDARDFLTAGAAAGVASAFGAPVGGLLFALEEVASTWSQTLTWQTFFAAMTATTFTLFLGAAFGGFEFTPPFGQLHAGGDRSSIEYYIAGHIDVNILLFVPTLFIGATSGVLGALFTFINLKWARLRRKRINMQPWRRIVEPMINMLVLASLTVLLSLYYPCTPADEAHPDFLADGMLVRLSCPVGEYNELATLMYGSGHNAVRFLLSRRDAAGTGRLMFSGGSVSIFFLIYFALAAIAAGSAVSSGLVVPMLLIGACIGRLYGILWLAIVNLPLSLAQCAASGLPSALPVEQQPMQCYFAYVDPGAFALVGAAAFFGGVSRLTIALTVIMIEITNDVRFLLPIMLGVMVAKWVADALTHSLYHAIIEAKCLPFLSPEVSLHGARDGDLERFTVADLLPSHARDSLADDAHGGHHASASSYVRTLKAGAKETYGSCALTLKETGHGAYPVLDDNDRLVGAVTRSQLLAVLAKAVDDSGKAGRSLDGTVIGGGASAAAMGYLELLTASEEVSAEREKGVIERCLADAVLGGMPCDLKPYTNASAPSVRSEFSLQRGYMLFRAMGLRHLIITDVNNHVVGVLTRRDLMDFRLHDVLHAHDHGHGVHHVEGDGHGRGGHGHGGHGEHGSHGGHEHGAQPDGDLRGYTSERSSV